MQSKRLNTKSRLAITILLLLFCYCEVANSVQILNNTIANPILKQYNKKKYALLGQVNVPIQIQQPTQIQPVYLQGYLIDNKTSNYCWFQSSSIKRNKAQYLSFSSKELGQFQEWDIQIIDATYLYKNETLVGLFTNGSLFLSSLSSNLQHKGQVKIQKIYNYASKQPDSIWSLSKYSLYSSNGALYLLNQQTLSKIKTNEQTSQWMIQNITDGQYVKKVVNYHGDLYVLKMNKLDRVQSDSIDQNIFVYNAPSVQFVDIAIYGDFIYILDKFAGIIVASKNGNQYVLEKTYPIDRVQSAVRINAYDNTIFVTYLIHHKNYIAQIFMNEEKTLNLNKFYYRYDRVSNILLYNKYAIAYSLNQMIVFQHSINRNAPINIKSSQFLSKTIYNKIVDIIQLGNNTMDFILVLNKNIYVQTLGQFLSESDQNKLLHKTLKCTFQKVGNYSIETIFQGICQNTSYSPKSTYCKQIITYQVQIHSQKIKNQEEQESTHLALVFLWGILLVLLMGVILVYRRRVKQKALKLLQQQKRRANSQMISIQKDGKSQEQVR